MNRLDLFDEMYREVDRRILFPWYLLDQARRLYRSARNEDSRVREEERRGLDLRNPERRMEVELQIVGIAAGSNPIAGVLAGEAAVFFEFGIREGRRGSLPGLESFIHDTQRLFSVPARPGHWSPRRGKAGPRWVAERLSPSPAFDPLFLLLRGLQPPSTGPSPAWQAFAVEAARHERLLRQLAVAARLRSQAARKMALLDYRSTYPGGVVIVSPGRLAGTHSGEKRSARRLPTPRLASRPSSAQARAAAVARARASGQYHDPLAWLPRAVAAAQAGGVNAAATKSGTSGGVGTDDIWADRNAKIAGGGR